MLSFVDAVRPEATRTVMQCPGCEFWQVDYTTEVRQQWTPSLFRLALEQLLEEHLHECIHLAMHIRDNL